MTRLLNKLGWRVEVRDGVPNLVPPTAGEKLDAATMGQVKKFRGDLIRLHTEHACGVMVGTLVPLTGPHAGTGHTNEQRPCGAVVYDAVLLAEANDTGIGCGCPYAHCPYRG